MNRSEERSHFIDDAMMGRWLVELVFSDGSVKMGMVHRWIGPDNISFRCFTQLFDVPINLIAEWKRVDNGNMTTAVGHA